MFNKFKPSASGVPSSYPSFNQLGPATNQVNQVPIILGGLAWTLWTQVPIRWSNPAVTQVNICQSYLVVTQVPILWGGAATLKVPILWGDPAWNQVLMIHWNGLFQTHVVPIFQSNPAVTPKFQVPNPAAEFLSSNPWLRLKLKPPMECIP